MSQKAYEKQLIARILSDRTAYSENSDILTPDLFVEYKDIFLAYAELLAQGRHPGITKITSMFPGRKQEIANITASVDYNVPVEDLVLELEEYRKDERLTEAIRAATSKGTVHEKIHILTEAITETHRQERAQFETAYEIAKKVLEDMGSNKDPGISTGFRFLDSLMGGWQPSDLIIVAGETSQGKTSLALNTIQVAAEAGVPVAMISLEMSSKQLINRIICSGANTSIRDLKDNYLLMQETASALKGIPLHVADIVNNSISHVAALIRSAHIRYNTQIAVVDYLQLVQDKSRVGREQEVGHIARTLKNLAKELDITIILVSQLRRATHGNTHMPSMSRLRDSGQIEEAADVVVFVYRPEVYGIAEYEGHDTGGLAEVIVAKGRNYGTIRFFVNFHEETTKFTDDFVS